MIEGGVSVSSMAQREMALFCDRLARLQLQKEFSITSWWRTVKHNKEVGGLPNSLHLVGLAVDCVLAPGESLALFLTDARIFGLHGKVERGCVHLQSRWAE